MHLGLKDKRVLVCGATSGIGWATAKMFANEGAKVCLFARNIEKLKDCAKELMPVSDCEILVADFSNPSEVQSSLKTHISKHRAFDIVINNTGGPKPGPAHKASTTEYEVAFAQHLLCNHLILLENIEYMKKNKFGRLINVISTSVKQPLDNLGVSNTIRAAVASWAKTLAGELGKDGITVNNVLPGATETPRLEQIFSNKSNATGLSIEEVKEAARQTVPMRRFAKAEEVAAAICFLASNHAGYINGINLPVDGGRTKSL